MDVNLPTTGCNILNSANSFYNYSNGNRTRATYYIYEGVAHLQSTTTSTTAYTVTGTCLNTGDLVYRPEIGVHFEFMSIVAVALILMLIYHLIFKRLLP